MSTFPEQWFKKQALDSFSFCVFVLCFRFVFSFCVFVLCFRFVFSLSVFVLKTSDTDLPEETDEHILELTLQTLLNSTRKVNIFVSKMQVLFYKKQLIRKSTLISP